MTERTRVKICGITRLEDAQQAARFGADALGFVFVPESKRYIDIDAAAGIVNRLPAFTVPVGLFLNADAAIVREALHAMPTLLPQFHGDESPDACEVFGRPYFKALGLGADADGDNPKERIARTVQESAARYPGALGFLLDSHAPGALGGTGIALDWELLSGVEAALKGRSLILAGGLKPANVAEAIHCLRPWAVDVSSGVEKDKGIKDSDAMAAFMQAVATADRQRKVADTA